MNEQTDDVTILRNLFGDNRAEWRPENFRELFVEPSYFSKLVGHSPSLLVGGRGTGKTTALQSLRYDATLERLRDDGYSFADQQYLGIFFRVNKNRVHAFRGRAHSEDEWQQAIAHYFNILICLELVDLARWLQHQTERVLSSQRLAEISHEFGFSQCESLDQLASHLRTGRSQLQLYVNNAGTAVHPLFSMAEAAPRTFVEGMQEDGLIENQTIFCCIDEYENLLPSHQAVINTYIKHAEPPLSFKIGVRSDGLHTRRTIDHTDLLRAPDDYEHIDIAREGFEHFARAVAEQRLTRARARGVYVPVSLDDFLVKMSFSEEANELGADRIAKMVLGELETDPALHSYFSSKPPAEVYFLRYWSESKDIPVLELAKDWFLGNESTWKTRIMNYNYASLFWLSKGRKGARIRKYYCGMRTITSLAGGNIRYFLEILDMAIDKELSSDHAGEGKVLKLSPRSQTLAAREIGPNRLRQLEDLADHGEQLKRLVLAIGKVFFELARNPLGSTPEVTSFIVSGNQKDVLALEDLLREGVAHLAFVSEPRTKATSVAEVRDEEYRLHPIFTAFFEFSHRRKRRTVFDATVLLSTISTPSKGISALLDGEPQTPEEELPDQLAFFSGFYGGGDHTP